MTFSAAPIVRAKGFGGFELEAGKLQHVPLVRARGLHHRRRRRSDVAAHLRGDAARLENMTGQRGGRGLAVRAGDADDLALKKPACQFQIADHAHAARGARRPRRRDRRARRAKARSDRRRRTRHRSAARPSTPARLRSAFRSTARTLAPFSSNSSTAATPLRAIPTTTTFSPFSFISVSKSSARTAP